MTLAHGGWLYLYTSAGIKQHQGSCVRIMRVCALSEPFFSPQTTVTALNLIMVLLPFCVPHRKPRFKVKPPSTGRSAAAPPSAHRQGDFNSPFCIIALVELLRTVMNMQVNYTRLLLCVCSEYLSQVVPIYFVLLQRLWFWLKNWQHHFTNLSNNHVISK